MHPCGVYAATMANFDGNSNSTYAPCVPTSGSPTLPQIVANAAPNAIIVGGANNDGIGLNVGAVVDAYEKITLPSASGGASTLPMDYVVVEHHPYSRLNTGNNPPMEVNHLFSNGFLYTFCQVMGCGQINVSREAIKHVWGYDPYGMSFQRAYDMPFGSSTTSGSPIVYERPLSGFALAVTKTGQVGATFWANYTGNSGLTDHRGPFIAFNLANAGYTNIVWLFYNSGSNTIGVECDPVSILPGLGCKNPATGKPPVIPSLMGNITVSAANPAVVSSTNPFGFPCTVGMTVAVPGAGSSDTSPNYASYYEPDIDQVTVCTDSEHMTLTNAATTPGTFNNSFVMSGNPIIPTTVTDTGSSGNELWQFEYRNGRIVFWVNAPNTPAFISPVMAQGAPFRLTAFTGGNQPNITIATDAQTGHETSFETARPVPVLTDFVDADVQGPSVSAGLSNSGLHRRGGRRRQ